MFLSASLKNIHECTKGLLFPLVLLCALLLSGDAFAQTKKELEAKKKQLQKDIVLTNKLLEETTKNKQSSFNQLLTLNQQIGKREELISTINKEIKILNVQISENEGIVASMEKDLKALKDEYAQMIYFANKNRNSYDRLMFIFSAEDFNQAYRRLKYFQQYSTYRQKQAAMILKIKSVLYQKINDLELKKADKKQLLTLEQGEKYHLNKEKNQKEAIVSNLQVKEKQLKKDLKKKEDDAKKLQKAIEKIIEEEIRKAKEAAAKAAKKATSKGKPSSSSSGLTLTPEAKALSADFLSNMGKLPWPVEQGIITSTFGEHEHPVLKGIKIKNNGLDISTTKGAKARAIFNGKVLNIIVLPDGIAVIISHGEYYTVYSNLKEVFVKTGETVKTKQFIGMVGTDESNGKTETHLEIWKATDKGSVLQNPSIWIYSN